MITIDNRHPTLRVGQRWLAAHLRRILRDVGRPRAWVDVSLIEDTEMRTLNRTHRGVDEVTDVLGFALQEGEEMPGPIDLLGDIVISLDTARRQARALQDRLSGEAGPWRLREETAFLATHGLLHLLGWDHGTDRESQQMRAEEKRLFASLSSVDPYALDRSDHALELR